MLQPLEEYICDYCGKTISSPMFAEIVFNVVSGNTFSTMLFGDYKLVHKRCGYHHMKEYHCNAPFDHFFNCYLLEPYAADIKEFQELMRRLTVPYYEEARIYLRNMEAVAHYYNDLNKHRPNGGYFETIVMMHS